MANPKIWGSTKFPEYWWPKKGGGADAPPPALPLATGLKGEIYDYWIIVCSILLGLSYLVRDRIFSFYAGLDQVVDWEWSSIV